MSCRAQSFNVALQRWLALQLELLGAAMLTCVAALAVYTRHSATLGLSGLSLTYALTLTALAKYLVNYSTRADAQFASVERLDDLARMDDEATEAEQHAGSGAAPHAAASPPPHWPSRGDLVLNGFRPAAYSTKQGNLPTLQPLTLRIRSGEHVALVGRSGACNRL